MTVGKYIFRYSHPIRLTNKIPITSIQLEETVFDKIRVKPSFEVSKIQTALYLLIH